MSQTPIAENTSRMNPVSGRDLHYFRQRFKNRVFARLISFFVKEAEATGLPKADIAKRLQKDPAQVSRWMANPSNLTLETISDLLLAMDAEADPPEMVKFADRTAPNYAHPLMAKAIGVEGQIVQPKPPPELTISALLNPKSGFTQYVNAGSAM